jgi:hypothetical protein
LTTTIVLRVPAEVGCATALIVALPFPLVGDNDTHEAKPDKLQAQPLGDTLNEKSAVPPDALKMTWGELKVALVQGTTPAAC